ncbi:MAG: hypothetical protein NZ551_09110 [Microscillaceae bacterium]|nr:hypothetical protein [Microscillaceae bacterium]MDW8461358.1 hypothetical protein [Cytophagales bacterium]
MIQFIFITLFPLLITGCYQSLQAQCQLCQLDRKNAELATNFLKTQPDIVIFAACEKNDIARKVILSEVKIISSPDSERLFEIFVKGTIMLSFQVKDDKIINKKVENIPFEETIDLAYTYICTGSYYSETEKYFYSEATCLGIYLGYDCNPCIDPFEYPKNNR